MMFELSEKQLQKLEEWKRSQYKAGVAYQKLTIEKTDTFYECYKASWDDGYPYTGAIGGEFTYSFTPNSIGETVKVKNCITGDELNLTDYESW